MTPQDQTHLETTGTKPQKSRKESPLPQKRTNNPSKNHHFIPEFYQKGFLSKNGELYVYNKQYHKISTKTPAQILYAKDLHTMQIGDETTLAIEEFYSQIEGELSKYISILQENIESPEFINEISKNPEFTRLAKIFTAFQFWRTPCKIDLAKKYSGKILELYNNSKNETKELFSGERKLLKIIQKRAQKDDTAKLSQFFILPLLTFDLTENPQGIKIFKAAGDRHLMSSDRPVIYDNINDLFSFSSFLLPLTKEVLLIGSHRNIPSIPTEKINKLIFDRALNRVISPSKEQLEEIKTLETNKEPQLTNPNGG